LKSIFVGSFLTYGWTGSGLFTPNKFSNPFLVVYGLTGTVFGVYAGFGYYFGFTIFCSSLCFGISFGYGSFGLSSATFVEALF
jgi:hypothetical protein